MAAKDFIIFILSSACGSIVARKSIYSQNTSLTNSLLISMCFPGITFPGSDNVPQRLFIKNPSWTFP